MASRVLRRSLRLIGALVGATMTFLVAAAVGAILHMGLPPARRVAAAATTRLLADTFEGRLVIDRVGQIGLHGVHGGRATMFDRDGRPVLVCDGVSAEIRLIALLRSLRSEGDVRVLLPRVSVDHVEAILEPDANGQPTLLSAFAPKTTGAPAPPPTVGGRGVHIELDDVRLRHAWAHGRLGNTAVDAEIGDLAGSGYVAPPAMSAALAHATITARAPLPREARLQTWGRVHVPADGELSGEAHVRGSFGRVPASADGTIDGERVNATVDVPLTAAEDIRDLVAGAPVFAPASAHVALHGTVQELSAGLQATLGPAELEGEALVVELSRATLSVRVRDADLRALAPSAPPSQLAFAAFVDVRRRLEEDVEGRFRLSWPIGRIAGERVPAGRGTGRFSRVRATGQLAIDELGMPASIGFTLRRARRGPLLDFDARVDAPDLSRAPRLRRAVAGAARARALGHVELATKAFDVKIEAESSKLARGNLAIDVGSLSARARGTLDRPSLTGTLAVTRGDALVRARIEGARAMGGAIEVDNVVVEGLGKPLALRGRLAGGHVRAHAETADLDVEKLGRFLGRAEDLRAGHLSLVADVNGTRRDARASATLELREANVFHVNGANARLVAALDGRKLSLRGAATLPNAGLVTIAAPAVTLAGEPSKPRSWREATGDVALDADVDLRGAFLAIPEEQRRLSALSGQLSVHAKAERARADNPPRFELSVATRGLVVQGARKETLAPDGTPIAEKPAWHSEGLDLRVSAAADPASSSAHGSAELFDSRGTFANVAFDTRYPFGPLDGAPVAARLLIPRRSVVELPQLVAGRLPVEGDLELTAEAHGTMASPDIQVHARGWALHPPRDLRTAPVDAEVVATYDGRHGQARARVAKGDVALLDAQADVALALADVLAGRWAPWTASARAEVSQFPLQSVGPIADRHVAGSVTGAVELRALHRDAALDARVEMQDLRIGAGRFPRASMAISAANGDFDAHLRLEQTDGFGEVHAKAGLVWGAELAPGYDRNRTIDVSFDAKNLRAASLKPALEGVFSELDGRIDANARLHAEPGKGTGQVDGSIVLSQGVFQIPAIGEEFRNAHATLIMRPWGTLRLDNVGADGITGHVDGSALARLDGLRLAEAEAHVAIDRGRKLPVSFQGVSLGEAWGKIDAKAVVAHDDGHVDVQVTVPTFEIDLPQSSAHAVQSLDPDPRIRIGTREPDGRFVLLPLEPIPQDRTTKVTPIHVAVKLGDDIVVKRSNTLEIHLTGQPILDIAEETRVSGQITLTRGKIEVQGKIFQIERGTVTFTGRDPSDPLVVATAYWDAPDGTRVYADFTGPVNSGKLALRSEPPHTKDEILALLLFGSPEGSFGVSTPAGREASATARATGLGGGFLAQGINKVLSGVTSLEVATRVDTSQANNPRPEVQVQISKDVAVQVAYNLGIPGPGDNPDRTLLMIDWRFVRKWLLETTVGDRGSSWIDLLWKHSY